MKNVIFLTIFSLLFAILTPAVSAESWDDYNDLDRAWDGQKTITNKEFEQVMDALQEKQKKSEARKKKRKARKISGGGTSLHKELNPDNEIQEIKLSKPEEEGILVNVTMNLFTPDTEIEKGFYNIFATKEDGKIYLNFYQSHFLKGKVEASETEEDFDESEVNFAKIIPFNENFVKIIYGSIDFNAYAYIPYKD